MRDDIKSHARVTAGDIAQAAGVSQATVSLALRGSAEISSRRIAQIRRLAKKMNYHPRAAAQLLRARRAGQIGALVASSDAVHAFSTGFAGPLLGSLVDVCAQQDLRYMIEFHHPEDQSANPTPPYQVTSGLTDGSVLIGDVGEPLRQLMAREHPQHPAVSIDEPSQYCVLADSRQGVTRIVQSLVEMGHRRLAYACGPQQYYTHHEGFRGWTDAVDQAGLNVPEDRHMIFGGSEAHGIEVIEAVEWARRLLKQPDRPTAFVCHDMVIARAVVHVATECGLAIPRDLSVTSWGWHLTAQQQYPALSTMELDYRAMVEQGVELLNHLIAQSSLTRSKVVIAPRYVEGATVAPPPA